jgi:DNA-binding transcriptional LysR family regulator
MDTSSLNTFVAIANKKSFSLAAEALHLTQPAVSKRILALETELGVRLFDRIGRQVQLTEAGRLFHQQAASVLQQLIDIAKQIENLSGTVAGKLRLGTSHHIGLHRMPPVLKHFSKQYSQVDLELAFMDSETACAQVLSGELELAVITLPNEPLKFLQSELLWSDPLHLVIANDHPRSAELLTTKTSAKEKFQVLESIPAVLPQPGTYTRNIMEHEFLKRKLNVQDRLATNFLETIKMMIKVGLGWSVLPQTMIDDNLRKIDLADFQLSRQLGIVWHQKRTLSNAASKMIEVAQKMSES